MAILPEPRLKYLVNQTGLTVFQYDKMAPGKVFCDVVVVKASFELTPHGLLRIASPGKLSLADIHRSKDEPLDSSLAQAGDLIWHKPGADIYFTGHARNMHLTKSWLVGVQVGPFDKPLARYTCAVTGPRQWQRRILKGWHLSKPQATQAVPIQYELAYGGSKPDPNTPRTEWDSFADNPCGTGFSFDGYSSTDTPSAPQWEQPGPFNSLKSAGLVGLGPVARFWRSRQCYAGTYDDEWKRQLGEGKIADYPADFDPRFFHCAHPALQTAKPLVGNEALNLVGLVPTANHRLHTTLPGLRVLADYDGQQSPLPLDTVHVDLDKNQVNLVWHLTLAHSLNIEQVFLSLEHI